MGVLMVHVVLLAVMLTFLGPIWIYHVVSPAIGAMHTSDAGSMPATPQPISAMTTVHFK